MAKHDDIKLVQNRHMDYQYLFRDVNDEKAVLMRSSGTSLQELNHWLYNGKKDFTKKFRVLVIGGGTGCGLLNITAALQKTDAEIVYIDFHAKSMVDAKLLIKSSKLEDKVTFIESDISKIPELKLGKFDYIDCSLCVHFLSSPLGALKILQNALKDDGGMRLVVHAKYGYTGVHQMHELMNLVNVTAENSVEEVTNARGIANILPASNWFMRGLAQTNSQNLANEVDIYDFFLHIPEMSYTIPELYDLVAESGMSIVEFSDVTERIALRVEQYVKDYGLLQKIKTLDLKKQQAIAEIIVGNLVHHSVYLTKGKSSTVANFDNLNNVPYYWSIDPNTPEKLYEFLSQNPNSATVTLTINSVWLNNFPAIAPVTPLTRHIFKAMIGGSNTLKEIFDQVRKDTNSKITDAELSKEMQTIFGDVIKAGVLLLRDKSVDFAQLM